MLWIYLFLGVLGDLLGIYFIKKFITDNNYWEAFFAFILFFITIIIWIEFLRYGDLGVMNTIWAVITILGTVLIGVFFFQENLSPLQALGIFICLVGMILIQWPTK